MTTKEKLRQDHSLLNFHINNSPLAFIEWDKNFRIKKWSLKARQIFGYAEEDVIGLSPLALDFLDNRARNEVKWKMSQLLNGEESSNKLETYIKDKNGDYRFIELYNSAYLDMNGDLISAISFIQDVTQRKEVEDRIQKNEALLSQLFQNSPIGIVQIDKHDRVVNINKSFELIFGYRLDEIRGQHLNKLIVPANHRGQGEELSKQAYSGQAVQVETIRKHKKGHDIPILAAGVPVNVGTDTIAIYGMYVDISDRKKTEDKLKRSLQEKETLLAEIHHRVKNNLAVISGLLELQVLKSKNIEAQEALKNSQARIISMAMVHERLYQSENLSKLDCRTFINNLAESVSGSYKKEHLQIELLLDIDSFVLNVSKAIPLGLILNELLVNAYRHAFKQGSRGRVKIYLAQDHHMIRLEVSDDGIGYPPNINIEDPQTLGMTLVNTLSQQLEGKTRMWNQNGSHFELKFKME